MRAACEGVGEVRAVSGGSRGVPILLLEERHDSRAGQIEQCVDGPMASAQSHPELIEEIDRRARQLSVDLEPEDKQAMAEYLGFLRGRGEANQTIARATGRVADQQSLPMVALTMGAGHTEAMVEDENGRFPITLSSVAGVAGTEEAARNIVLTRSHRSCRPRYAGRQPCIVQALPNSA